MRTSLPWSLSLPRVRAAGAGLALLLLAAWAAAAPRPVLAVSPITVDTLLDGHNSGPGCASAAAGGRCTLRAAIEANEAGAGGLAITLGVPGQIKLTLGQLIVTKNVAITGAGAGTNVVAGSGAERVFAVGPTATVTMSGFTITGGTAGSTPDVPLGGGILDFGGLTLTDVDIEGNVADAGGGIAVFGTLDSTGGVFTNTAQGFGGSVLVGAFSSSSPQLVGRGSATFAGATIANGTAPIAGGVEVDGGATATFTRTTFVGNAATGFGGAGSGSGGAIESDCGSVKLVNDTLNANRAAEGFGGGIFQLCGDNTFQVPGIPDRRPQTAFRTSPFRPVPASVATSPGPSPTPSVRPSVSPTPSASPSVSPIPSISPSPSPGPQHADASLDFVTMAGNVATPLGGAGIFNAGDASTIQVHDTIVANKAGGTNCVAAASASTTSRGYNLEDAKDCGFAGTGDQTGVDPALGALAGNGGPTQTMALAAGTPAVDAADPNCDVTTDQRGVSRPQPAGGRCDIGAFELQVATSATPTPLPSPPVTGQGPAGPDRSRIALIVALLALAAVGAVLLIARRRSAPHLPITRG